MSYILNYCVIGNECSFMMSLFDIHNWMIDTLLWFVIVLS